MRLIAKAVLFLPFIAGPTAAMAPSVDCSQALGESSFSLGPAGESSQERVEFEPLSVDHIVPLADLFADPDVNRFFLGGKAPHELVQEHIQRAQNPRRWEAASYDGLWVIKTKEEFAGLVMLTRVRVQQLSPEYTALFSADPDGSLFLSLGFALHPNFRGRGLASQAVQMALHLASQRLRAKAVVASTNALNLASQSLLTRSGFSQLTTSDQRRIKFYKVLF